MTPSDADLPFVLLHGPWVWKAMLLGAVVAVMGVAMLRGYLQRRAILRARLGALELGTEASGVVRGTLVAPRLIETAEGRVALDGEIAVVIGSVWGARRPAIAPGAAVLARGVLARAPVGGERDYREGATAWTLRAGVAPIQLAARAPRIAWGPSPIAAALVVVSTLVLGFVALHTAGAHLIEDCEAGRGDACRWAAAMPGQQDAAFAQTYAQLAAQPAHDVRSQRRLLFLAGRTLGCAAQVELLAGMGRDDAVLDHARRCGLPREQHEALVALGYYREAAAIALPADTIHPQLPSAATLAAAEQWDLLAARMAQSYWEDARCRELLFRAYAGHATARDELRTLARTRRSAVCSGAYGEKILWSPHGATGSVDTAGDCYATTPNVAPAQRAMTAALRSEACCRIGDAASAVRWTAIYARHVAVLDHRRLVALSLLR